MASPLVRDLECVTLCGIVVPILWNLWMTQTFFASVEFCSLFGCHNFTGLDIYPSLGVDTIPSHFTPPYGVCLGHLPVAAGRCPFVYLLFVLAPAQMMSGGLGHHVLIALTSFCLFLLKVAEVLVRRAR